MQPKGAEYKPGEGTCHYYTISMSSHGNLRGQVHFQHPQGNNLYGSVDVGLRGALGTVTVTENNLCGFSWVNFKVILAVQD